jgi:uncharacterized membrane protein YbhN (UPF0104 family)
VTNVQDVEAGESEENAKNPGAAVIGVGRPGPGESSGRGHGRAGEDGGGEMAAQSRRLRNSIVSLLIFFALMAALLLGVPGLRSAARLISRASPGWVVAGIVFEVLSCLGYVVLFGFIFGILPRRVSSRLSLAELAVNSVVSVSGLAGIALGAWVMRTRGISVERIAKRSVLIFVLTSAVNVGAVAIIGPLMWVGLVPGSTNPLLTLLPAGAAILTVAGTLLLAGAARRAAARRASDHGRWVVALTAVGGGIADALHVIRGHDWRVLGAVAYWAFDNLTLFACLAAFGHAPVVWAVAMAYLVGMLANSLPVPGGFVAVEGGLVGMLLLFGARPASKVLAAVVIYRAISLWVPALIGSLAFLGLRREIDDQTAPSPSPST